MSGAPSSKCRSSPTSTSPTSRRCSAPRRRRSCRSDGRRHLQAAAAAHRDHHGRQRPLGGCARAHAFGRPPRRAHAGAHVYRGVRAPRRGGPHAVRFLERELESAGGGGRQSHGPVPRGARPRDRGAARQGCTGALRRGTPQSDRKSTRLNSSHVEISYAVFCLKKKKKWKKVFSLVKMRKKKETTRR